MKCGHNFREIRSMFKDITHHKNCLWVFKRVAYCTEWISSCWFQEEFCWNRCLNINNSKKLQSFRCESFCYTWYAGNNVFLTLSGNSSIWNWSLFLYLLYFFSFFRQWTKIIVKQTNKPLVFTETENFINRNSRNDQTKTDSV